MVSWLLGIGAVVAVGWFMYTLGFYVGMMACQDRIMEVMKEEKS